MLTLSKELIDKVLIVEDNSVNQKIAARRIKSILGLDDKQIVIASNGIEGLKAIFPDIDVEDKLVKDLVELLEKSMEMYQMEGLDIDSILENIKEQVDLDRLFKNVGRYQQYRLILMDDIMPTMKGSIVTALTRILDRELSQSDRNYIISFSDTYKDSNGVCIAFPGANQVVTKPVVPQNFELVIGALKSVTPALSSSAKNEESEKKIEEMKLNVSVTSHGFLTPAPAEKKRKEMLDSRAKVGTAIKNPKV